MFKTYKENMGNKFLVIKKIASKNSIAKKNNIIANNLFEIKYRIR